jgi:hypothetical protein
MRGRQLVYHSCQVTKYRLGNPDVKRLELFNIPTYMYKMQNQSKACGTSKCLQTITTLTITQQHKYYHILQNNAQFVLHFVHIRWYVKKLKSFYKTMVDF